MLVERAAVGLPQRTLDRLIAIGVQAEAFVGAERHVVEHVRLVAYETCLVEHANPRRFEMNDLIVLI